jgi:hypothetical protein
MCVLLYFNVTFNIISVILWWSVLLVEETGVPGENNRPALELSINTRTVSYHIFASQGLRFGPPFSPPLADLEYILSIRALIFHWLRLPVHVSNQKTFYTEHMLSTKCKQKWHRNALI